MSKLLLLLLLLNQTWSAAGKRGMALAPSALLKIRGGGGHSPFELNPTYSPTQRSPPQQNIISQPTTLGDLDNYPILPVQHAWVERQACRTLTSSWIAGSDHSPLDRIRFSFERLHQTSPTLSLTTVACLLVFIAWQIPFFHGLLQSYFVCSGFNVQRGRIPCILLSALSHASGMHLLVNLLAFLTLGPSLQHTLEATSWSIFSFVTGAALAGSLAFLIRGGDGGCMGLSGVTLAMMSLQAKLCPQKEFRLVLAVFPVTLKADMALTCLLIWSLIGSLVRNSKVAHITHLGGLLFGMGYYELWVRRNKLKHYMNKAKARLPGSRR